MKLQWFSHPELLVSPCVDDDDDDTEQATQSQGLSTERSVHAQW
jgi:hypothetical protein